jgi:hypothetical protein
MISILDHVARLSSLAMEIVCSRSNFSPLAATLIPVLLFFNHIVLITGSQDNSIGVRTQQHLITTLTKKQQPSLQIHISFMMMLFSLNVFSGS